MPLTHADLLAALPHARATVDLDWPGLGPKQAGKVRDSYRRGADLVLAASDRLSAFDQVVGLLPYKGQVLTQLSAWWFACTGDIVPNHLRELPAPHIMLAHAAEPLPVEVVVRGYLTGSTSTSLWRLYSQGERQPYGVPLPDGLRKNDPLPRPIITPTTKAAPGQHDARLTAAEIVAKGLVAAPVWAEIEQVALALFARGQQLAAQAGLILVDTKYEFGVHAGQLMLIDELHTPDSSRFWTHESYATPEAPHHLDKEYVRLWYAAQGYHGQGTPPPLPPAVCAEAAARYLSAYERLTGSPLRI